MTIKILSDLETGYVPSREYAVKVVCKNCGTYYYVALPKGYKVRVQLQVEECPNCGCTDVLEKA